MNPVVHHSQDQIGTIVFLVQKYAGFYCILCVLVTSRKFSKTRHRHLGVLLLFNMAATQPENDACPSDKALNSKLMLSSYGESLEGKTKRRYVDKNLSLASTLLSFRGRNTVPNAFPQLKHATFCRTSYSRQVFTRRSSSRILKACLHTIRWCPDL